MVIFTEIVKFVVLFGIVPLLSYLYIKNFKEFGMFFPSGIKKAEPIDWAIGVCILILVFFANLSAYSILLMILRLVCA